MIAILCLALVSADGPPSARAMVWEQVMVDTLADMGVVHDLEYVLPKRQAYLIRALGCEHHHCRWLAREEMAAMGHEAFTALLWGARNPDVQVRETCRGLVDRLWACSACRGSGEVSRPPGSDSGSPCSWCGGAGDLRYRIRWVRAAGDAWRVRERIDFFTPN